MSHIAAMEPVFTSLAFFDGLGGSEMLLVFVLILVLFGGQKLPEFARGLGKSIREFKKAAAGVEDEFKRALEEDERKRHETPALMPPPMPPPPAPVMPIEPLPPEADTTATLAPDVSAPIPPAAEVPPTTPAATTPPATETTPKPPTP